MGDGEQEMRCPVSYRACITGLTSLYIFASCFAFDTATTSIVKRWICNTDAKKSYLNFFLVFGFCGGSIGGDLRQYTYAFPSYCILVPLLIVYPRSRNHKKQAGDPRF